MVEKRNIKISFQIIIQKLQSTLVAQYNERGHTVKILSIYKEVFFKHLYPLDLL